MPSPKRPAASLTGPQGRPGSQMTVPTFRFSVFDEPHKAPSVAGCSENRNERLDGGGKPKTGSEGKTISTPIGSARRGEARPLIDPPAWLEVKGIDLRSV